jgi:uncharacterized membrane protein YbhN (UPF0104 family)
VRAAYPDQRLRYRSALGAYTAGVGVNSFLPARGGDLVKLYLIKSRIEGARYATLAPTLIVETIFDFFVAGGVLIWALSIGVLPTHQVYSRIPDVDWKFFLRHERFTAILLGALLLAALIGFFFARKHYEEFRRRVGMGFAILRDRRRFLVGVIVPQAISWVFRIASNYFFLEAFHVQATLHNALLVQVVESLATLFPATPGGAGTKQGLIVFLFRGETVSKSLLLAFSVGQNIAILIANVLLGLVSIGLMARTLSFKRLRTAQKADAEAPA